MMFNKLNFDELATFYTTLSTLEKHYGKELVRQAVEEMADRLDDKKAKIHEVVEDDGQLKLFEGNPEPSKKKKKQKPKRTQPRVVAEEIAKDRGHTLDEFLAIHYYNYKMKQIEIANILGVSQETISTWIRDVPQQTIQRIVGASDE